MSRVDRFVNAIRRFVEAALPRFDPTEEAIRRSEVQRIRRRSIAARLAAEDIARRYASADVALRR